MGETPPNQRKLRFFMPFPSVATYISPYTVCFQLFRFIWLTNRLIIDSTKLFYTLGPTMIFEILKYLAVG